jgi:hypothetical protein
MSGGYLRRYTQLPALIYFLTEKKLTLLDPKSWSDSNDSYYLSVYRDKKRLKTALALCFAEDPETYHHWSVFASGSAGVCIHFKRAEFIDAVRLMPGIRAESVRYRLLTQLRGRKLSISELPFSKRYAFQHENEFRVIFESEREGMKTLDIPIPLDYVVRITLSPWLPKGLMNHLKRMLRSIDGCEKLVVVRSTLVGNQEWKNRADAAK